MLPAIDAISGSEPEGIREAVSRNKHFMSQASPKPIPKSKGHGRGMKRPARQEEAIQPTMSQNPDQVKVEEPEESEPKKRPAASENSGEGRPCCCIAHSNMSNCITYMS